MIFLLAALLETAQPDAHVEQRIAADPALDRCLAIDDPANANDPIPHIADCYDAAQARADAALATGYARLRSTYAGNLKALAAIDAGEKAFLAYRDTWCQVDEAAEGEPRMIAATAKMCRFELTRYQLYRIDSVG